ncbi:YciI family protein [Pelagibacterium lentulum]|uniref:YCII-related domain-containing protein n=1 Tax=Pelagibacterium lentulum TaxID=2029865 RepID=A0A916VUM4_9HYPH|nr:YciI family protein [Pelagibacterium lentulum]GGA36178.1 hypothetical protein GCM10011499_01920 [Pelagibacterium lentulum]
MLFAVHAKDKPGHLETRLATRPAHLAYWEQNDPELVLAGPFLDDDGKPCGSLIVVRADDLAGARALIDADPYAIAGLFESVTIQPWNWALKRPEGV